MGLTNKKEEMLKAMPKIQTRIMKAKDKDIIIHQTIITDIKPIQYYNAVITNTPNSMEEFEEGEV